MLQIESPNWSNHGFNPNRDWNLPVTASYINRVCLYAKLVIQVLVIKKPMHNFLQQ